MSDRILDDSPVCDCLERGLHGSPEQVAARVRSGQVVPGFTHCGCGHGDDDHLIMASGWLPPRDDRPPWFQPWTCSRCGAEPGPEVRPALSRADGSSPVCPRCGVLEALEAWLGPVEAARILDDVMAAEAAARDLVAADLEEVDP